MSFKDIQSKDLSNPPDAAELMNAQWAPCKFNCPVHADVRCYIELAAMGRWRDAIDVIREKLPFASVCGRICHHPCEANCRRNNVDQPVAIREVKRFVSELQGADGATVHKADKQDKGKVAIIGAGPAGMAAALELAKLGYRPTVFEKFPIAGGIPATAIPNYRLPNEVIQQDIDWICAHGVEMQTGVEIGKDKTIADLKADGFEAILVATGLANSRMLDLPGADCEQVFPVLEFLTELAFERKVEVGDDVLVIGGGNVAMDAARSARRLGAKRVRAMCLENEEEMPAWDWEQHEANEEGVEFIHRRGPVEIVETNGKIKCMRARKVLSVFDDQKRFSPVYDDNDIVDIECDTVIMAIGQMPDFGFIEGSSLAKDDRGRLAFTPATQQTNQPEIFACGEIVTPPGSAVEACASGQRVAQAIDMHLSGKKIDIDDSLPEEIGEIPCVTAEKVIKVTRQPVDTEPGEKRCTNFDQVDHNYASSIAAIEARRCMNCGGGAEVLVDKCASCLTCLRVCPFDIPVVTDVARIDSALCQSCGICIAECPANAIVARSWNTNALVEQTAKLIANSKADKKIVAYICGYHATPEAWADADKTSEDMINIFLPSTSRLSAAEILHAFENGADGVIVIASQSGEERYPKTAQRTKKRIAQVKELLAEVGISESRCQLAETAGDNPSALPEALAGAVEAISAE